VTDADDLLPAELALRLARDRFWQGAQLRLIATHPKWPEAAWDLGLPEEVAHALVLVLSRLPEAERGEFAEEYFASRSRVLQWWDRGPSDRLAVAAGIVLHIVEIVRRPDIFTGRLLDLLQGAAQGDDLTRTPDAAVAEVKKAVARIRFDIDFDDPADPRGAAALAVAEVLDPSSDVVALQEVLARAAWAAAGTWEPSRVLLFLLDVDRLVAGAER
jgi:hypothetical protein